MIESVTPTGNACVQMMMEEAAGMRVEWVLKVKLLVPWEFGWVCGDAVLCCATGHGGMLQPGHKFCMSGCLCIRDGWPRHYNNIKGTEGGYN
ncbi:unnamed protein product [Sphagnum troendelagicum]